MAIVASDIPRKFSVTTGSAGNTTAGTAAASFGKYLSTTSYTDATLNNLFRDFTAAENAGLTVLYRCLFLLNNHASLTLQTPKFYLLSETAGGANIAISLDTTGVTAKGSASAQAKTIASETTAPASQTFSSPTTLGAALTGSDIPAASCQAVWIRATATGGSAQTDGVVIRCEGLTGP